MANILVTGATGFIGSRLISGLANNGHHCVCLVRDMTVLTHKKDISPLLRRDNIEWVQGGLDNSDHLVDVMGACRPDIILHVAGLTPHLRPADPAAYDAVNVVGSRRLLNAAKTAQNAYKIEPKLIYASTVAVYGTPQSDDGVVHEDDMPVPATPYAVSKRIFEEILKAQDDIPYAILRYANIPGRDSFINLCLVKGNVTLLGDTPFIRDYIHMDDLTSLHDAAINYLQNNGASVTLNAGSGIGFSFPDIVEEVARQSGVPVQISHAPTGEKDMPRLICDMNRAKNVLGWGPQITNLDDIISYAMGNYAGISQKTV